MSVSRKEFCRSLNTNADDFGASAQESKFKDSNDPSIVWLEIDEWNQKTQFATLCRLLLNFALNRIVLIVNNEKFQLLCDQIEYDILKDPFFASVSRIKDPKSMILIDCVPQKYLPLHPIQLFHRFSQESVDENKLQIIIIHKYHSHFEK